MENTKKKGNIKGGSGSGKNATVTVPQFNPPGPKESPLDPNSASVKGNQNSLQAQANASGDCYATNSCGKKGGTRSCLLYTSPSPRDRTRSRMPSSA